MLDSYSVNWQSFSSATDSQYNAHRVPTKEGRLGTVRLLDLSCFWNEMDYYRLECLKSLFIVMYKTNRIANNKHLMTGPEENR